MTKKKSQSKETEGKEKKRMGAPPNWETPQDFEDDCSGFFDWCEENDYIPDIEGLAVYLGTTRKTILDYEKKDNFCYTVKKIKNKIAFYKKQKAMAGQIPSAVFCFDFKNNHNYVDKTEVDNNIKGELTQITREIVDPKESK